MLDEQEIFNNLSNYLGEVVFGSLFLFIGIVICIISIIRRDKQELVLVWLSIWSGIYGIRILITSPLITSQLTDWLNLSIPYMEVSFSYLILFFALLAWIELSKSALKLFLKFMALLSLLIATAGILWYLFYNDPDFFMLYNNLLASVNLLVLIIIIFINPFYHKLLNLPNRKLLGTATFIFACEALYTNLARFLGYNISPIWGWLGFALFLTAMAISALEIIFANERRLLSIESDLETARKIQSSILPEYKPDGDNLSVSAAYYPMASVAGDFYDFLVIDEKHSGYLIADVSGHGISAALIASMVKIAIQSAIHIAESPQRVLKQLAEIMSRQLRSQFITAAYLFIDLSTYKARYSAAGHPPLLYWNSRKEKIESIESNGLLISSFKEDQYPVIELNLHKGDRFLMYTDGISEAENKEGNQFGEGYLNQLLIDSYRKDCKSLSTDLYLALSEWVSRPNEQQDDYTWIIIDIS
jgi:sigma-B regulation protein RsbU (phosphoserine phosphatase)